MEDIEKELVGLQIISPKYVSEFYPQVRDRDDIKVYRCSKSGVIFLKSAGHVENQYYETIEGTSYWTESNRNDALKLAAEDDNRRLRDFQHMVRGKSVLDVGTGLGGMLDRFSTVAKSVAGLEIQKDIRETVTGLGYKMYSSIENIPVTDKFDVISLFHVFEHINTPLDSLKKLRSHLNEGGSIIIEVPHAKDALISVFNSEAFKKSTFWSEHLVLHTRQSLEIYLREAGFKMISVKGLQRYHLANHLWWLTKNEAGGHEKFPAFRNEEIDTAYEHTLQTIDATDTLIAIAK